MKCVQARRLFGAYWDDDATQAEREWLESHFVACASCRAEYESYSRVLEVAGSLPRVEPAPDFLERTLARARRAVPTPDRIPTPGIQWVPITAAAALLLILGVLISPWVGLGPGPQIAQRQPERPSLREPVLVRPTSDSPRAVGEPVAPDGAADALAAVPDSLFDHSEDVEFILDPVTLRRGRATVTRPPGDVQGERAVITF